MPTGYTAKLENEGQSFEEFVWTCARAFGALVLMRDDSLDAQVPEKFEPSTYAKDALDKARAELERLRKMTLKQARKEEAAEFARMKTQIEEANARSRAATTRYEQMAAQIREWVPPTPDHEELRRFMQQQISEGARFLGETPLPERKSPAEWRELRLTNAAREVAFYEEDWKEEQERTERRNQWIADLRRSVPAPTRRTKKGSR